MRRAFLASITLGLTRLSTAANPAFYIACLSTPTVDPKVANAFRHALAALDPNLAQLVRYSEDYANFDIELLRRHASMLNRRKPDIILCFDFDSAAAVVAARTSNAVPIVFRAHDDPLGRGLIENYARPGRNLTGITTYRCIDDKLVEVIRDAVPTVRRIGFIHNAEIADAGCNARARAYASGRDISLLDFSVSHAAHMPTLLNRIATQRPQALIVAATAVTWLMRKELIAGIDALAIPALYEGQVFVDDGGLMQFSALQDDAFDRMARAVSHVLRHGRAGEFPVSQPTQFELVINLKARHARHYQLSAQTLRRADRILE
ncbi:ABC transporter substrate-binding protein [Undibacterium sp. Di26W]|uniref:ABC transporter substrate-binding protein n=1 Tax=Undibacterium sp. Di26W TaxID=3413035 RepID=UPI003BEF8974